MANNVIDSISYNSNNYIFTLPYGECSTAAATAAKTVQVTNFSLETGACVIVKFTVTNTASSPTLNVSDTGAKSIYYRNSAITAGYLAANRIYLFVYDGTQWELIGDIDTNTTYSAATPTTIGLMPADDKYKSDCTNIAYGTCSTAAATAAKVVTINGNTKWTLAPGSMITVLFSATNSAENPTLNVNDTGAKNIFYGSSQITTSNKGYAGTVNRPMTFMYDGTQYRFIGWGYDANTTYSNAGLGQGYGTCATEEATTAKVVTLSSYALSTGGVVSVKFTYAVPASSTMNINSKGAKSIYYRGAAITANIIKAGDIATFIYNGSQYLLISIDRWQSDIEGKAASSHNHSASNITSGTLGVARGGTGATTFTSGAALIGAGTGAVTTRTIRNNTATSGAVTADTALITSNTLRYAINRTTSVAAADTNYTTYMARGASLNNAETNPTVNGTIAWTYE